MSIKPSLLTEPTFVGREAEIRLLESCLASAIAKKGRTVFIQGEAGSGKTRLVNEFLTKAKKKKVALLTGWCLSNACVPYFPFIEAFDYLTRHSNQTKSPPKKARNELEIAVRKLIKLRFKKHGYHERYTPNVWKDLTFATVAKVMQAMSELHPTVLFIDDLHWADSSSLSLLHYISHVLASKKVLIIVTFRGEELHLGPAGQPHPLIETMRLMRRDDLLNEIILPNLSHQDVVKVAEQMVGELLEPEFVEKLAKESRGNPLYVVESMRMLFEHGHLVKDQGYFRLATPELGVPAKVKDIILRRIGLLKSDQRRILELASVVGEKFDPKLLGAALSMGTLDALEVLHAISTSTSLVSCDENCCKFDHAKSREVLYGEIPLALKKEYHARIAETLEKETDNIHKLRVNDIAYHYAQAAKEEKAVKYAVAAGEDALARFSNAEAIDYFTYVLQTVSETVEYSDDRNKAMEGLGDAYLAKGKYEDAEKSFEKLITSENGITCLRTTRKAMDASFWRGDLAHSLELASKAEKYASLDRLEYSRLLVWRGRVTGFLGNTEAALKDLEQSLQVFEENCSLPDIAHALREAANLYVTDGQVKKAVVSLRRAIALYQELEDFRGQMETLEFEAITFFSCGLHQEARDDFAGSIVIAEKLRAYNDLVMNILYFSLLLESKGDLRGALTKSLSALDYSEKTDSLFLRFNNYHLLSRQYAKLGDIAQAKKFHEKFMAAFEEISHKSTRLAHASGVHSNAVFFASKGNWEEANALFEKSLELLMNAVFSTLVEPIVRADYASCLAKQGRVNEARVQEEESEILRERLRSRLEPGEVQAVLMAKRETVVGEELEVRLDVINVCRRPVRLLRVESLFPSSFKVNLMPMKCVLQGGSIDLLGKELIPFGVESIKFTLRPVSAGAFNLTPSLTYEDSNRKVISCSFKPEKIVVNPKIVPDLAVQTIAVDAKLEFEFKTEEAKKTFDYLLSSFVEDYMRRRLPLEWSGWRTLMEVTKHARISKHAVYGDGGSKGRVLSELEHRGLVEVRVFPGERGRGGKIKKVRIFYEREIVKRRIDQKASISVRKNGWGHSRVK